MRLQQVANACPFFRVAEGKDRNGCEKIGRRAEKSEGGRKNRKEGEKSRRGRDRAEMEKFG